MVAQVRNQKRSSDRAVVVSGGEICWGRGQDKLNVTDVTNCHILTRAARQSIEFPVFVESWRRPASVQVQTAG